MALKKIKTPIVVIIDDIDRLTPKETFQVLRLVKAVADFPGVSFLLAFDPHYLVSVLNKNDIIDAHEYINKVIQLRAPLPITSNSGMEKMLDEKLIALIGKNSTDIIEKDRSRWSNVLNKTLALIKNPRDLKRLFNHLRLVVEQVKDQVDFIDLFVLSLIATRANFIYEYIKKTPCIYAWDSTMRNKDKYKIEFGELFKFSNLSVSDCKNIEMLILGIFPLPKTSANTNVICLDRSFRVSMPQRLYTALHYGTPIEYVSDLDILNFISGDKNREAFLKEVLERNAGKRFIEMMELYAHRCEAHRLDILKSIYIAFDSLEKGKNSSRAKYSITPLNTLTSTIISTISNSDQKFELILNLMEINESAKFMEDEIEGIKEKIMGISCDKNDVISNNFFQKTVMSGLAKALISKVHFSKDFFKELRQNNGFKECLLSVLGLEEGVVTIAYMITHLEKGICLHVDEKNVSDILEIKCIQKKASKVDLNKQPKYIQDALKIMQGGKKILS